MEIAAMIQLFSPMAIPIPQMANAVKNAMMKKIIFMMTSTTKTCLYYIVSVPNLHKKKKPFNKFVI